MQPLAMVILSSFLSIFVNLCHQTKPVPSILKVTADGCTHGKLVNQTGFFVAKPYGIVTALHGVVGCTKIEVTSNIGSAIITVPELEIQSINLEHDVAVLKLPTNIPDGFPTTGLTTVINPQEEDFAQVCAIGYPLGIVTQLPYRDIQIRPDVKTSLRLLLPPGQPLTELLGLLEERNSPSLGIEVLNVEGELDKGLSGAPIINQNDQVIGVVNGGLKAIGVDTISWGIPWEDITEWQPYNATAASITTLQTNDASKIFSFDLSGTTPIELKIPIVVLEGEYIQVTRPGGIELYDSPLNNAISIESIKQYAILQAFDGPHQTQNSIWRRVFDIQNNLAGWVKLAENDSIYVNALPVLGPNIHIQIVVPTLNLRSSSSLRSSKLTALRRNQTLKILEGPQVYDGLLWWQLQTDDNIIGWAASAGSGGSYFEVIPSPLDVPTLEPPAPTPVPAISTTMPTSKALVRLVQDGVDGSGLEPAKAFDKQLDTAWTVPGAPRWLKILFRTKQIVSRIRLYRVPETPFAQPKEILLTFSDGTSRSIVFAGYNEWEEIDIEPIETQEIRLEVIKTKPDVGGNTYIALYELEFYGLKSDVLPTTEAAKLSALVRLEYDGIDASGLEHENAFDKQLDTAWKVPGAPRWFQIVFRTKQTVSKIRLYRVSETPFAQPKEILLTFSDGTSQSVVFNGYNEWEEIDLEPTETQEIKLEVIKTKPEVGIYSYIALYEIEFLGTK